MNVFKPPMNLPSHCPGQSIFLAGSIEMGAAAEWQTGVETLLEKHQVNILNPRRDHWDSSWEQSIRNPLFVEQVTWEMDALNQADHIIMYFDPNTKSPVSLLELGLHAGSGKLHVICPAGFWRKGNVDIVCKRFDIPQYDSIVDAIWTIVRNNNIPRIS